MKDFSIGMAMVDFIPVICFALAALVIIRALGGTMSRTAFALFAAGAIDITCAGALKATYKLLYAAGVCDFASLSDMFFPVQSIGFLLAGVGMLLLVLRTAKKGTLFAVAPPLFKGTFVFVGLMVAGLGMMDAVLCILSVTHKRPWLIALFSLSFVCSLCMGYLSSQNFAEASMNWIAEGVNIVGQGALLAGSILLERAIPKKEDI